MTKVYLVSTNKPEGYGLLRLFVASSLEIAIGQSRILMDEKHMGFSEVIEPHGEGQNRRWKEVQVPMGDEIFHFAWIEELDLYE